MVADRVSSSYGKDELAILAGIDEAGLGPMLGPLVVTGVAFRVSDDHLDRCLWRMLRSSCAAAPKRAGRRVVVADSKQLYRPRSATPGMGAPSFSGRKRVEDGLVSRCVTPALAPLERTALVMLAVAGARPRTFRELLDRIAPGATDQLERYPWYAGRDVSLPLSEGIGDIPTQANAVRRDCARHGVAIHGVFSEPLPAGHYNRLVKNTRNKAIVLLGLVLRVADRLIQSATNERIRLCVDRLGGRTHYREALMTALPGYDLRIHEESQIRSAYSLVRSSRICEIEFVTGGEARHFAVALASVYSKYLRELYMDAFNEYWSRQVADLHPTAGYYTDAKRWLNEASAGIERHSIDRNMLVRQR